MHWKQKNVISKKWLAAASGSEKMSSLLIHEWEILFWIMAEWFFKNMAVSICLFETCYKTQLSLGTSLTYSLIYGHSLKHFCQSWYCLFCWHACLLTLECHQQFSQQYSRIKSRVFPPLQDLSAEDDWADLGYNCSFWQSPWRSWNKAGQHRICLHIIL